VKKSLSLLLTVLVAAATSAQITVSKSVLTYPKTSYKIVADQEITIQNDFNTNVDVILRSHNADFYVDDSTVQVAAKSSLKVTVHFKPTHNITYNSELVVVTDSRSGSFPIDLKGVGEYSAYYTSTFDLYEEDLKGELKSVLAKGYKNLGYSGARDAMYGSIDNTGGKVECVYTGRVATFNTRSGANSNSFNCEHTWPQSLFNQNEPERADIHHLFPTDVNANGRRSNYRFGVVSNATWTEGGSKLGGGVFEPRDAQKGDCARSMLYFAVRYQNYASFLTNQESLLRSWATTYAPSQQSIDRNNAIFNYQKNRNPFVDYPEFLERINKISTTSTAPKVTQITPSVDTINNWNVASTATYIYPLVFTNTGNQTVLFTNFANSTTDISFPKTAFEIAPNESHVLKVSITPTANQINDVIELVASGITLKVPVQVNGTASIGETSKSNLKIAVNGDKIQVRSGAGYAITLINLKGQEVYFNEIQSNFTEIETSGLASGVYFVQAIRENQLPQVQKVLIP
jgi:hypothetical protein